MRQRKSRRVRALLLGATITALPVVAVEAVDVGVVDAAASMCSSHLDSDNITRGQCFHLDNVMGADWYYTWENCTLPGSGTRTQYSPTSHYPSISVATPRCYGTVTSHGIQHS